MVCLLHHGNYSYKLILCISQTDTIQIAIFNFLILSFNLFLKCVELSWWHTFLT